MFIKVLAVSIKKVPGNETITIETKNIKHGSKEYYIPK